MTAMLASAVTTGVSPWVITAISSPVLRFRIVSFWYRLDRIATSSPPHALLFVISKQTRYNYLGHIVRVAPLDKKGEIVWLKFVEIAELKPLRLRLTSVVLLRGRRTSGGSNPAFFYSVFVAVRTASRRVLLINRHIQP